MINTILGWLAGGGVAAIGKQIAKIQKQRLDAENEQERIDADKEIASLQARKDVLVAEARSRWNVAARAALAAPFGIFVWKVIVWDKVLGLGTTDDLSPNLWNLMMVVFSFYFVYEVANLFRRK